MIKRIAQLDIVRSFAILCVILCHTLGIVFVYHDPTIYSNFSVAEHIFSIAAFIIGRIGVPLFLFLTGYFLLSKTYSDRDIHSFYKKKWLKLFLVTELWLSIFYIANCIAKGNSFNVFSLIKQLLFVGESPLNHAYYLPLILGYYLTIPFTANALNSLRNLKCLRFPLILLIIFCFLVPTINSILYAFSIKPLNSRLYTGFIGGDFGIYIIMGFLLRNGFLKRIKTKLLAFMTIASYIVIIAICYCIYHLTQSFSLWYDNIFLLVIGVCLFELISRIKNVKNTKFFYIISYYSFAIYLVHAIFLLFMTVNPGNAFMNTIAYTLVVFILSIFISYIIGKIPKIGKKILYLK